MRTLVSYLNEKTPQQLHSLSESWQATLLDRLVPGQTHQLSLEMQTEFLQRRLLEQLNSDELDWLAHFLAQPDYRLDAAQLPPDFMTQATRLRLLGLFFQERVRVATAAEADPVSEVSKPRSGWAEFNHQNKQTNLTPSNSKLVWLVPRELARPFARLLVEYRSENGPDAKPHILTSRQPLTALLKQLEPEILEVQAENWQLLSLLGQAAPAELAQELSRVMADKTQQEKILAELPNDSQELFTDLRQAGGRTTVKALLVQYVSLRRLYRALRPLTEQLLVWQVYEEGQSLIFIPSQMLQPVVSATSPAQPLQTVTPQANINSGPEYALAWDSLTFLNYIEQNQVELTTNHAIPKRELKKLNGQLWHIEEDIENYRLGFLVSLCQKEALYEIEGDTKRLIPGPALTEWLKLDLYALTRQLIESWKNHAARIGPVSYPYYYASPATIQQANQVMLSWLADCEPGQWYSLASLQDKVQHENPYFILPRRTLLNQLGSQRLTEISKMWPRLEGEIIHQTFKTALVWLGIIRVSLDNTRRVTAFQLTEMGASVVGRRGVVSPVMAAVDKPLLVQPNFEILLFSPQTPVLWVLLKFANLKQLDQVSLYTLSRDSVLRGLESSLKLNDIIDWLQRHSPQPLPQNLLISLTDWSKGFRRVMIEKTTVLEVEDPAVLDELLSSKQYAEYFVRRLSPTAAIVNLPDGVVNRRSNPLKTFKTKLKAGGYFADSPNLLD